MEPLHAGSREVGSDPVVRVDEFMREIREELLRSDPSAQPLAGRRTIGGAESDVADAALELKDVYRVEELTRYEDEAFVRNAYLGLLHRSADPEGSGNLLAALRSGSMSKVEILGHLRYSPEGRSRSVRVYGLRPRVVIGKLARQSVARFRSLVVWARGASVVALPLSVVRRLGHVPVLGKSARWAFGLVRAPWALLSLEEQVVSLNRQLKGLDAQYWSKRREWDSGLERVENDLRRYRERQGEFKTLFGRRLASKADAEDMAAARASLRELERIPADLARAERTFDDRLAELDLRLSMKADRVAPDGFDDVWEVDTGSYLAEAMSLSPVPLNQIDEYQSDELRYHLFEAVFYKSGAVKQKQRAYLPYVLEGPAKIYPFLDAGCGRGEFLDLLRESGLRPVGVDVSEMETRQLRERGFDVHHNDVLSFLKETEILFSGVSALQVIEHLEQGYLLEFLRSSFLRLAQGGVLILETINPHSPYALANFYQDPTHVRPLPPELIKYLAEWTGFTRVVIVFSSLLPEEHRNYADKRASYQDYAVIGYKP